MAKRTHFCTLIVLLGLLTGIHTTSLYARTELTPERVLHFSPDYSIGNVYIENETYDHTVKAVNLWVRNEDWQFHVKAQGDVTIPAGHRVKLQLIESVWQNRERAGDLSKLPPDAIYTLSFRPEKWKMASDWLIPYLTCLTGLKELDLSSITVSGKSLDPLSQCSQLEFFRAPPELTNRGLKAVSGIRSLKRIYLLDGDNRFTDKGLSLLKTLPQLEELLITGPTLTDQALEFIADMKGLEGLYLSCPVSNGSLVYLKELPNLKILRINIDAFDDNGMHIISGIPTLERFSAHYIKNMPCLKMLDLKHASLTDESLKTLGQMPKLEYLEMPRGFTDDGIAKLSILKNLKFLWISTSSNSMLGDRSMEIIGQLTQLEELIIGGTNITDKGVRHINNLKQLQRLGIFNTQTTDQSLQVISGLPMLRNVSLRNQRPYSTDGLNYLNQLTHLESLACRSTMKGQSALDLSNLKNLEYLFLIMDSDYDKETRERTFRSLLTDEDAACFEKLDRLEFF
ncbi:MAG: leucine-rich repeat domain-containing protein, partial [Planctomycetota bacterium]